MRRRAFNKYNATELMSQLLAVLEKEGLKDAVNTLRQKKVPEIVNKAWKARKNAGLREAVTRLAHRKPELRKDLLPLLEKSAASSRVFRVMDQLLGTMREAELLDALVMAMSDHEAKENFKYIARMNDFALSSRRKVDMLDEAIDFLGESQLLEALVMAMSDKEAIENFEYIARMYDISL